MAQVMTQAKFDSLKPKAKPYRVAVGHNVWVNITPTNFKTFIYRKMKHRKKMVITLGSSQGMELHDALTTGSLYNKLLANGEHLPTAIKRSAYQTMTWREAAEKYLSQRNDISPGRVKKMRKVVITDMTDEFNDRPIASVDKTHIKAAILPFWDMPTAKERLSNIAAVWYFGVSEIDADVAVSTKMEEIKRTLPKKAKRAVKHLGQLSFADLQKWLANLDGNNQLKKRDKVAAEISLLTNKRPSEITLGEWDEIDFDNATWTIPAARLKSSDKDHVMPLSSRVIELLKQWQLEAPRNRASIGHDYIFVAEGRRGFLDIRSLNTSIDRYHPLGTATNGGKAVMHGTARGTFKTWSKDQLDASDRYIYENDAVELQLAHAVGTEVERAYNTANGMKMRRKLVEDYSLAARSRCQ